MESGSCGALRVFDWVVTQFEKLSIIFPVAESLDLEKKVICTAQQKSTLQHIVQQLDKYFACAITLNREHATPDAASSKKVRNHRGAYSSQHRYLRTKGLSLYLDSEGSPDVLTEIYQPAMQVVSQCRLVHIDNSAARDTALNIINLLYAIGLHHIPSLGFAVLCPETPQDKHIIWEEGGHGLAICAGPAAGSGVIHAPTVTKRAIRTIRQNPAFGTVYPQVHHEFSAPTLQRCHHVLRAYTGNPLTRASLSYCADRWLQSFRTQKCPRISWRLWG